MIKVYTIGARTNSYKKHIEEYLKRMPEVKLISIKTESRLPDAFIALMEEGKTFTSQEFAKFLKKLDRKEINFVIGPAEGLSENMKRKAQHKVSLSLMTFPHELAALLAVEQIYRAKTIIAGKPYHK
jgi:23S rRNA (pseudouridine1915-N3)-methyltransferase